MSQDRAGRGFMLEILLSMDETVHTCRSCAASSRSGAFPVVLRTDCRSRNRLRKFACFFYIHRFFLIIGVVVRLTMLGAHHNESVITRWRMPTHLGTESESFRFRVSSMDATRFLEHF